MQRTLHPDGRVSTVRARFDNTRFGVSVALLSLCACVAALPGCGGSSGRSPQALLADTFSGHTQIESGRLSMSFAISTSGSSAATSPLSVTLSGPFDAREKGRLPRFALKLGLSAGGHALSAGATATGSALYVQLAGSWFSTPSSTYKALEASYAQATKRSSSAKANSTFASLGIEPSRWLSNPSRVGTTTVGGVETVHLSAGIDVPAFLADVSKLSQAGTTLGLASPLGGAASIAPAAIDELAKSIKSAHVDVYTGAQDHALRRMEVTATVAGTPQTRSLLGGLSTANVRLLLEFEDLNRPQAITPPANPQPASGLLPALQQLVGVLQSTASGGPGTLEPLVKG